MADTYYIVKKGDTLYSIAKKYGTTVDTLVNINGIVDRNRIVVGQKIYLSGNGSWLTSPSGSMCVIRSFGLQSDTDRTVYASWAWTKSNTKEYKCFWWYDTGNGTWFLGSDSTSEYRQSIYNAPSNAKRVKFAVKPVSKTRKVNGKETSFWTGKWCAYKTYSFSDNPPTAPSAPSVEIDGLKLTAKLNNLSINATEVYFQVIKNDKSTFKTGTAKIRTSAATFSCSVSVGGQYKVRCRGKRGNIYGAWSEYSSNVGTQPNASKGFKTIKALSETSVQLDWYNVSNVETYELEYTTKKMYFDSGGSEVSKVTVESVVGHAEVTGLESGQEYFFRVRAVNSNGESAWCPIKSIVLGKEPSAPTTWSSSTTVVIGEPLTLYWIHNTADGSSQTVATLELIVNGTTETKTITITNTGDDIDKTSSYAIDTSTFTEGTTIQWRVKTAGITKKYGDWSIQRTVDIYVPPTLELTIATADSELIETLTSFPFYISALALPSSQMPIGYHLMVTANEAYTAVDQIGNEVNVNAGDAVYSKYFDTSDMLLVELSAGNIDLENNIGYTVTCTASMNSGLKAENSMTFSVEWTDEMYEPNAEIGIDQDSLTASIRPYCEDEDGNLIEDVLLSIYRREFDGTFTEIETNLENTSGTYVTDPHPALDYARYRIVAISKTTGAVSYYDLPGEPVGEKSVIIQWNEDWTYFETSAEDEGDITEQPPWSGSLLRLPYNVDVSDKNSRDVSLVEYIGRKHPVSYYGTQLGESATWKVEIDKEDEETLYGLRQLAIWMGDVYVREPSGSGYWASLAVSFSQTHKELTIPVTFEITRVEGGK